MRVVAAVVSTLAVVLMAPAAGAVQLVATNGTSLTRFDSAAPGVTNTVGVTGLQAGETLVGIDARPATGVTYGVGTTSRMYVVNTTTGAATQVGTAGAFTISGTAFGMDFNPAVDRIRHVSNNEQNIRLNPNDGTLSGTDTPLNPPGNVVGAAYTNNFAGATSTTLYDIDSASGLLEIQGSPGGTPVSPNNGTLTAVGPLGLGTGLNEAIGFEITPGGTAFATITTGGISRLYTIDLATGAATLVGAIGTGATPFLGLATSGPVVLFSSPTADAAEGATATLTVLRRGTPTGAVTVDYSTSPGTASGDDYTPTSGTLSWAGGDTAPKTISVPVTGDSVVEGPESFTVALSNPTGSSIDTISSATVTIADDDQPGGTGNPPPGPGGTSNPDTTRPALSLTGRSRQRLRTALKRGIAFAAKTNEACALTTDARITRRLAKRLGISRRIGRKKATLAVGRKALRVKPSRKARRKLRRLRKVKVTLKASCVDAAGNRGAAVRSVTLKR